MRITGLGMSPLAASLGLASLVNALPPSPVVTDRSDLLPRSAAAATHTVQVGGKTGPHQFVPSNITADPGDTILFEFYPTNHSVAKADFLAPCVPADSGVFWSGSFDEFKQDDSGNIIGDPPTWSLLVNDTEPVFFYCTALGSCRENGMVGVINPNSSQTFDAQYNAATNYPIMRVPGQTLPAEGSDNEGNGHDSGSSSSSGGGHGLSKGAIAGIVVAVVAFIAILGALLFVLGRNRILQKWASSQDARTSRTNDWAMSASGGSASWAPKSEAGAGTTAVSSPNLEPAQWGEFPREQRYSEAPDTSRAAWNNQGNRASDGYEGSISRNKAPTELPAYDPLSQNPDRY